MALRSFIALLILISLPASAKRARKSSPDTSAQAQANRDAIRNVSKYDAADVDAFITKLAAPTTAFWNANPNSYTKSMSERNRKQIDKFAAAELADFRNEVKSIFYPFAGADVFYPFTLFPNADTLYMIAIEPVGVLPDTTADATRIADWYNEIFKFSFFRTVSMKGKLGKLGCTTAVAVGLKAMGYNITSVKNFQYTAAGVGKANGQPLNRGVEIKATDAKGKVKTVVYFNHDLSDGRINFDLLQSMLQTIKPEVTVLKAASYLLHNDKGGFAQANKLILDNSPRIIQSDTGIPYRQYAKNADKWSLKFYGTVPVPIGMFSGRVQSDLQKVVTAAIADTDHKQWGGYLEFPYDYQYQPRNSPKAKDPNATVYFQSNMMIATKVK